MDTAVNVTGYRYSQCSDAVDTSDTVDVAVLALVTYLLIHVHVPHHHQQDETIGVTHLAGVTANMNNMYNVNPLRRHCMSERKMAAYTKATQLSAVCLLYSMWFSTHEPIHMNYNSW